MFAAERLEEGQIPPVGRILEPVFASGSAIRDRLIPAVPVIRAYPDPVTAGILGDHRNG